jgi:hypothetical protein
MSSECERVFSATKRMIIDDKYCLKNDVIQAEQYVKSWLKNKVIDANAAFTNIAAYDNDESSI